MKTTVKTKKIPEHPVGVGDDAEPCRHTDSRFCKAEVKAMELPEN